MNLAISNTTGREARIREIYRNKLVVGPQCHAGVRAGESDSGTA
jgi:hypothetical protein